MALLDSTPLGGRGVHVLTGTCCKSKDSLIPLNLPYHEVILPYDSLVVLDGVLQP